MAQNALVLGGSGFLGGAIVRALQTAGWKVISLGRGNKQDPLQGVSFLQADRTVPGTLAGIAQSHSFDLVVDCAAYKRQDVADAVQAFGGRIQHYVFISTDYIYANNPYAYFPIKENAPKQTDTAYAQGKIDCEAVLHQAWIERQFPSTILRPPHIMGAGKGLGSDIAIGRDPNLLNYIRNGKGLRLLAEGKLLIQPVWNREIADCIVHIAKQEASFGQAFNCTGPECVTNLHYYQMIADHLGVKLEFESISIEEFLKQNPDSAHYARHRMYDLTHLKEATGYDPHYRLEDALLETLDYMRQLQ